MLTKSAAQSGLLTLLGLLLVTSAASAQDSGSAERFFGYLDRNRDGRLDGEEMRRMPSSFRESLQRADFNLDRGISRDEFVRQMPRLMEESRRRRDEERGRESSSSDEDRRREYYRRREEERRREDERRGESDRKSSYVYKPAKQDPVTMRIPRRFEEGDTDKDGQIGLYEWRNWRPEEKYHFRVYDINGDGFLTPKELSIPPTQDEINNYLASIGVKVDPNASSRSGFSGRSRDRGSRGDSSPRPSGSPQADEFEAALESASVKEEPEAEDRTAKVAMIFFKSMDQDKSGTITSEEWARSAKLKPKFEEAGYDLSKPMDQQQFIAAYRESEKPN